MRKKHHSRRYGGKRTGAGRPTNKRGGQRDGAGRPKMFREPAVMITKMEKQVMDRLAFRAKLNGVPVSRIVRHLIDRFLAGEIDV